MSEPKHVRIVDGIPCITLIEHEHLVNEQLAESQAHDAKLRDALEKIANNTIHWYASIQDAKEALTLPADDTALKEAIMQTKREVLLEVAEWFDDGYECSAANNIARELRRMAEEILK